MLVRAPRARTAQALAATAKAAAARSRSPAAMRAASAPEKASPAPVVSTAVTPGGGARGMTSAPGSSSSSAPSDPVVTMTGAAVRPASTAAALRGSVSPVSRCASPTLGEDRSEGASPSADGRAGAGLTMTGNAARATQLGGGADGLVRDLEAYEEASGSIQCAFERAPDVVGPEGGVGAGSHGDLIVTAAIDDYQRRAGRLVRHRSDSLGVDPLGHELRQRVAAQRIVPDGRDKPRLGAHSPPRPPRWRPCPRRTARAAGPGRSRRAPAAAPLPPPGRRSPSRR